LLSEVASIINCNYFGVHVKAVHKYDSRSKVLPKITRLNCDAGFIMKKIFAAVFSLWLAFLQKTSATSYGCGEITHITLVISEEVISPACSPRKSLVVNGTLPGPALHVNAGEHIHVR